MMFAAALMLFAISFCIFAVQSGDVLMHLALARDYVMAGRFDPTDIYVYADTDKLLVWTHEWLSHLLYYGGFTAFGPAGLIAVKTLALTATFALIVRARPREQNGSLLWMMLWTLAILAGSFRFIERASIFSDLLTVWLATWLLARDRVDRGLLLRLALLFLVWVQLHPGFVVGIALIVAWAAYHRPTRAYLLALPPLALFLNPTGFEGPTYPFLFGFREVSTFKRFNPEWFPLTHPAFALTPESIAFWVLLAAAVFTFWRARREGSVIALPALFALIGLAFALTAVRFVPVAAFLLVLSVKPFATLRTNVHRFVPIGFAILLTILAIKNFTFGYGSSSGDRLPRLTFDPKFFPTKTLEFLKANPQPGHLYNSHDLGSSLIWNRIGPVFHHGFVTDMRFFKEEVVGAMTSQERFGELAAKYDWTVLLVDRYDGFAALHPILSELPEWKIVAEDEAAYLIYKLP